MDTKIACCYNSEINIQKPGCEGTFVVRCKWMIDADSIPIQCKYTKNIRWEMPKYI